MTRRASASTAANAAVPDEQPPSTAVDNDSRSRYQRIHDQLKSAIALGRLQAGLVLLEGPVARVFGTSRVPVRKAFEMLHAGGLLHTFEGRGYVVAYPDGTVPEPLRLPLSEASLGFDEPPPPLDIPTNGERIYDQLEAVISLGIVFGHFKIDESDAAQTFGVSRGIVREVLSRLRDRGLVEKSAYSHWLCGPLTARAVSQYYELRILLEPAALLASAPRLSRQILENARHDIDAASACPDAVSATTLHRIEMTLHGDFFAQAPNRKLVATIEHAHMPLIVNHAFYDAFRLHPDRDTLIEHRAVIDLLLAGEIALAAQALTEHLKAGQKRTLQRLKVMAVLPEPTLPGYMQRLS